MPNTRVGLHVQESTPRESIEAMVNAEQAGIGAAWVTTGGSAPDGLTLLAAAAVETSTIRLGTSIIPTYPRHPLVVAQQTLVMSGLAPGRFVLGVGPSHRQSIENVFGIPFRKPIEHLREYLTILRQALDDGKVEFDGQQYHVHGWRISNPPHVPILLSALRPASYRLAGRLADGAISWITPSAYLRDHAVPALREGMARRTDGRTARLVAHCFAVVSTDSAAVREAARERLEGYLGAPFYQEMFAAAGYPEARQRTASDAMIDAVVAHGDEAETARRIRAFLDAGADEVIVSILPVDADPQASKERTLALLARMSTSG